MNALQCRRWLEACAATDKGGRYDGALAFVAEKPDAEWEGSVRGAAGRLRLRADGEDALWDCGEGRFLSRGKAAAPKGRPFKAAEFGEPVAGTLAAFHRLAPVKSVARAKGSDAWTLELETPLPWPLFLRCDVSAAFTPRAAQLSLLLRDLRVRALDFDGEELWARLG